MRVHSPSLDIAFGHVNSYEAFEGKLNPSASHSAYIYMDDKMLHSLFLHG